MVLIIFLIISLVNHVLCVSNDIAECVEKGVQSLASAEDVLEWSQTNFQVAIDLADSRSKTTRLECYREYIKKYWSALKLMSEQLNERLAKAESDGERSDALARIATMSQVVSCEQQCRTEVANDTVECSPTDVVSAETRFNTVYSKLKSRTFWANIFDVNKNRVIGAMITQQLNNYSKMFYEAKACIARQPKAERCVNYKQFAEELEQFFALFEFIQHFG